MDSFMVICDDGRCCCLPQRKTIALISIINLVGSLVDAITYVKVYPAARTYLLEQVDTLKTLLITVFQMANLLLLLAAFVESATLLQLYLWYSLGFIVLGLMINIIELAVMLNYQGISAYMEFIVEAVFLFVTFRCLPLVDRYRKQLDSRTY